jgi:hypothetical protein
MLPGIGQVVLYALTEEQAAAITRHRRESSGVAFGPGVLPGDVVPLLVAACAKGYDDGLCAVSGRLLIDEDENWWVTSLEEGVAPGAWRLF